MKQKTAFLCLVNLIAFSALAAASYDDSQYDFVKDVHISKSNGKPIFGHGDSFYLDKSGVVLFHKGEQCRLDIKAITQYAGGGTRVLDFISRHGGEDIFYEHLKNGTDVKFQDFNQQIFLTAPPTESFACQKIAEAFIFKANEDIVLMDENEGYKFSKRKMTQKEREEASGIYQVASLPISEMDVDCEPKRCDKNKLPVYDGAPSLFKGKKYPEEIDHFSQLPSISDVQVYLGTYFEEHEKEEDGHVVGDGGELFTYLLTLKGEKVNYVRFGSKYTIDKDYRAIKTLKDGKLVKYAIKPSGIIIKLD